MSSISWYAEPSKTGTKQTNRLTINKSDDTNLENITVSPSSNFLDQIEDFVRVPSRDIRSQWRAHFVFVPLAFHPIHWRSHGHFYIGIFEEHLLRIMLPNLSWIFDGRAYATLVVTSAPKASDDIHSIPVLTSSSRVVTSHSQEATKTHRGIPNIKRQVILILRQQIDLF